MSAYNLSATIVARQKYKIKYPKAMLAANWKLTEQVHQINKKLSHPNLEYKWVQKHQNTKHTIHNLTLASRYSIWANELATDFMNENPMANGKLQSY